MARRPRPPIARTRMRMVLWSLPVVIIGLLASVKLISMPAQAQLSIDSYRDGYYESSAETAGNLLFLNLVERWIPYFDRGTAYASGGAYTPATDDLSVALELAPEDRKCMVRVNLARAWEQQGDYYFDAGYYQGAVLLYQTAKSVIDEGAEAGCFEQQEDEQEQDGQSDQSDQPPTDGQQDGGEQDGGQGDQQTPDQGQGRAPDDITPHEDPGENLDDADRRTQDKIREAERRRDQQDDLDSQQDGDSDSGQGGGDPQQDAIDRLRDQGDDAEQEKQNEESEQRGQENDRGYVEKPW